MGKAKDDKALYASSFWDSGWSPATIAAAKALYGRMNFYKEDRPAFEDLDDDTSDHYCIAARHAVRAFHRAAESAASETQ